MSSLSGTPNMCRCIFGKEPRYAYVKRIRTTSENRYQLFYYTGLRVLRSQKLDKTGIPPGSEYDLSAEDILSIFDSIIFPGKPNRLLMDCFETGELRLLHDIFGKHRFQQRFELWKEKVRNHLIEFLKPETPINKWFNLQALGLGNLVNIPEGYSIRDSFYTPTEAEFIEIISSIPDEPLPEASVVERVVIVERRPFDSYYTEENLGIHF
jgi:hypothetical protein